MFNVIVLSPISRALPVTFTNEDEPCTTKSPLTYIEPVTLTNEPDKSI